MIETVEQRLARLKSEAKTREARAAEYREKMNLPVPVLAEPTANKVATDSAQTTVRVVGEARESTQPKGSSVKETADSRGGQTPQEKWRKKNKAKLAEYQRLWRAAKKLKEAK